jgi:site-specific DNA-methyltransferase (adenine-specific)
MTKDAKIYTGDCLKILPKMADGSVNFAFTDPPYNVGKDYEVYKDDLEPEEYKEFMRQVISQCRRVSNNRMAFFVSGTLTKLFLDLIPDAKLVVVAKGAAGVMSGSFRLQYHSLLVTAEPIRVVKDLWDDVRLPGEGYFYTEERTGNPGQTSEALTRKVIENFTSWGDLVFDPFMGCGTTALASLKLGRRCEGIEINQRYCEIAEKRIEQIKRQAIMKI